MRGDLAGSAMRVLVVEDEALILGLTESWLEDLGCEVETALNGDQAVAKLRGELGVDLLITDVNMPGMSGYELAERARRIRHGLKIILLSGAEIDPHGLPLIRKPFLQSDLRRVVATTMGAR
jgi:CheY-like chemotaxis protein